MKHDQKTQTSPKQPGRPPNDPEKRDLTRMNINERYYDESREKIDKQEVKKS
jgi:hypothetical protein